jgi:hypothetical protein
MLELHHVDGVGRSNCRRSVLMDVELGVMEVGVVERK